VPAVPRGERLVKQSGPLRRKVGMTRTGRLNPESEKTKNRRSARRRCVELVVQRDQVCQFWPYLHKWVEATRDVHRQQDPAIRWRPAAWWYEQVFGSPPPPCFGRLTAHEPAHRRNSDCTDPAQCIALCEGHNGWAEDHPRTAYTLGLLVRGNGIPLRDPIR
jgi:hypothetical protein